MVALKRLHMIAQASSLGIWMGPGNSRTLGSRDPVIPVIQESPKSLQFRRQSERYARYNGTAVPDDEMTHETNEVRDDKGAASQNSHRGVADRELHSCDFSGSRILPPHFPASTLQAVKSTAGSLF